jgi:hypothetical protein
MGDSDGKNTSTSEGPRGGYTPFYDEEEGCALFVITADSAVAVVIAIDDCCCCYGLAKRAANC